MDVLSRGPRGEPLRAAAHSPLEVWDITNLSSDLFQPINGPIQSRIHRRADPFPDHCENPGNWASRRTAADRKCDEKLHWKLHNPDAAESPIHPAGHCAATGPRWSFITPSPGATTWSNPASNQLLSVVRGELLLKGDLWYEESGEISWSLTKWFQWT
ncbi:hypothetical protein NDU88_011578 [Pleurodeles waltl]|uniref:Uncharacterized protein n=1 Tax=Pleurodeles waltl TaxID=8319 RepID=A0AAV7PY59_PLEWA|nr:hypothetical protein NDU88_011578 [Pleurodeles waltl]